MDEESVMHSKNDNIKIMSHDKAYEVFGELFESLFSRNQIGLETSMKGFDFIFEFVSLLYYKCHKTNIDHGGLYTGSPGSIKSKKATIHLVNYFLKRFQHAATVALNHAQIRKKYQKLSLS